MSDQPTRCPSCQGTHLIYGKAGTHRHTFIPNLELMFFGYPTRAFVCLHCGYMGHYVEVKTLKKLRSTQGFEPKRPSDDV